MKNSDSSLNLKNCAEQRKMSKLGVIKEKDQEEEVDSSLQIITNGSLSKINEESFFKLIGEVYEEVILQKVDNFEDKMNNWGT